MKTARGVYHDLKESEYIVTVDGIKFYFSSELYRQKFLKKSWDEKERFNESLNRVYKNQFDLSGDVLAWIRLYNRIEKRGFYIVVDGVEIECLENLAFDVTMIYRKK